MRAVLAAVLALLVAAPAATAVEGFTAFQTPSRNIGCVLTSGTARCDIAEHDWPTPRRPASCGLDYGSGMVVSSTSRRGSVLCAGDTTLHQGRVVAYRRTVRRGRMRCTVSERGVTCRNRRDHGFRLSRQSYGLF